MNALLVAIGAGMVGGILGDSAWEAVFLSVGLNLCFMSVIWTVERNA